MIFNDVELLPYVREAVTGIELDPDFVLSEIRPVIEALNLRTIDEYQSLQRIRRGEALGPKAESR